MKKTPIAYITACEFIPGQGPGDLLQACKDSGWHNIFALKVIMHWRKGFLNSCGYHPCLHLANLHNNHLWLYFCCIMLVNSWGRKVHDLSCNDHSPCVDDGKGFSGILEPLPLLHGHWYENMTLTFLSCSLCILSDMDKNVSDVSLHVAAIYHNLAILPAW